MTDSLNFNGLTVKTNNQLLTEIRETIQEIYSPTGEPINFSSSSPDGQFTQILANIGTVHRELLSGIYNATDPSKCEGTQQDTKYQLNYLQRNGGSWTIQPINIAVNKTVTLQGLDGSYNEENASSYTVSDDAGNLWYLIDTTTLIAGSTSTLLFRAQKQGEVIPTIGTITNQVTIVPGVLSVVNDDGASSIGVEKESNQQFRIRREQSVAIKSGNNADSIEGNIRTIEGVVDCKVWENNTSETDETGTLAHYIWVIVEGGANTDIAETIYANIAGAGMRGDVNVQILTTSAQTLNIKFDRPKINGLYIKFDIQPITNKDLINEVSIKEYIDQNLTYLINENAETSKVTNICSDAMIYDGEDGYALNVKISKGGTATASISTSTGITEATVDYNLFQDANGDETGTYNFIYTTDGWDLNGDIVEPFNYGITYSGTPQEDDIIEIDYTEGEWVEYLTTDTIQDKFVTSTNRIYINILED